MTCHNKILKRHLEWAITHYSEHIDFTPVDGLNKWMTRIRGLDGNSDSDNCLVGAEIIIEFDTTQKFGASTETKAYYPFAPPRFYVHTPNGLYGVGNKVCVDQGEFHAQNYDQTLGVGGFAMYLLSGLSSTDKTHGIRHKRETDTKVIAELSAASKQHNVTHQRVATWRMVVQHLALIGSGLYRPDPMNVDRLIKVHNDGEEKKYKELSMAIIGWALSTEQTTNDVAGQIKQILGRDPTPACDNYDALIAAATSRFV